MSPRPDRRPDSRPDRAPRRPAGASGSRAGGRPAGSSFRPGGTSSPRWSRPEAGSSEASGDRPRYGREGGSRFSADRSSPARSSGERPGPDRERPTGEWKPRERRGGESSGAPARFERRGGDSAGGPARFERRGGESSSAPARFERSPGRPPCPAVLKKVASAIAPPPIDDRRIVVPATVVLRTVAPVSAGSVIAARPIGARWIAGLLKAGLPIGIAAPVPSEVGHRLVGLGCSVPPVAARPAPISALRRSVPIAINRATPLERRWRQTPLRLLLPTT